MIILQDISYIHPNKDILFDHVNLTVNRHDKTGSVVQRFSTAGARDKNQAQSFLIHQGRMG